MRNVGYRFAKDEVSAIANNIVGMVEENSDSFSGACLWLSDHPDMIDKETLKVRLFSLRSAKPHQIGELVFLVSQFASENIFEELITKVDLTSSLNLRHLRTKNCATINHRSFCCSLAEIAFLGLSFQPSWSNLTSFKIEDILQVLMQTMNDMKCGNFVTFNVLAKFVWNHSQYNPSWDTNKKNDLAILSRQIAIKITNGQINHHLNENDDDDSIINFINGLNSWANLLDGVKPLEKTLHKPLLKKQSKRTKSKKR